MSPDPALNGEEAREQIIEAMSWAETFDDGRIGRERADALLRRYEASLAAAIERVRALCDRQDEIAASLGAGFPSQLDVAQIRAALTPAADGGDP